MKRTLLYLVVLLLPGCAMQWVRSNTTQTQMIRDRSDCDSEATSKYPVSERTINNDHWTNPTPHCDTDPQTGATHCDNPMPEYKTEPPTVVDDNQESRDLYQNTCMKNKGYVLKPVSNSPTPP